MLFRDGYINRSIWSAVDTSTITISASCRILVYLMGQHLQMKVLAQVASLRKGYHHHGISGPLRRFSAAVAHA